MDAYSFDPFFRPALIVGLAALLGVAALAQWWRLRGAVGRGRAGVIVALRLLLIAGLALLLLRPMRLEPEKKPLRKPVFPIVVDRSASMETRDAGPAGDKTRQEAVLQALKDSREALEKKLQEGYSLRLYEFSDQLRPVSFDQLLGAAIPQGEQTDIATALLGAAENGNTPLAGMLLISDGRVNQAAGPNGVLQAARTLKARQIPVWTATVGKESKARDAYLTARLNQNFLYVRQPGAIEVTIEQSGYKDWPALVHLKREGVEVSAQQTQLTDGAVQLSFPLTEPAPGLFQYTVELDPLFGEADQENNRRAVFVRVTDRRTQVLVVEAEPYWDSKFMLRALRKDPNLEVTSFYQVNTRKTIGIRQMSQDAGRDPAAPKTDTAPLRIPRTPEELAAYDAVIIGRGAERIFSAEELKMFKNYLTERGGNLIFARSKPYDEADSPLADLEPVVWGDDTLRDIRFSLTEKGRDTFNFSESKTPDLMIRELPTMLAVTRVQKEKSLAVVLARTESGTPGDEVAVISWQRYGKGKVMSIGSAGLWRWSLVPDNAARYQGIYEEFWSQLVRWLVAYSDFLPSQEITFEANRNAFHLGEQVRLTVRTRQLDLKNYHPLLELTRRGGTPANLQLEADPDQPGVFGCSYLPDAEGEYVATLRNNIGQPKEDTVRFTVYQDSVERRFVAADQGLMTQIARVTGGESLGLDQLKGLPDRLGRFEQLTAERRKPVDAWDKPSIFYLLMGLASLEWLIRRQAGLV